MEQGLELCPKGTYDYHLGVRLVLGHLASADHNCFQKNSYDITQVAQYLTQLVEQLLLCLL